MSHLVEAVVAKGPFFRLFESESLVELTTILHLQCIDYGIRFGTLALAEWLTMATRTPADCFLFLRRL